LAIKDAGVDALAAVHIHELCEVTATSTCNGTFNLFDLRYANAGNLSLSYSITVENNSGRVGTIALLETLKSSSHTLLQRS